MARLLFRRWLPAVAGFVAGILCYQLADTNRDTKPPPVPPPLAAEPLPLPERYESAHRALEDLQAGRMPDREAKGWVSEFVSLRYEPAIPYLIANVDNHLDDEIHFVRPGDMVLHYPCMAALQLYGSVAVPSLVDAILGEHNPHRRYMLYRSIFWAGVTKQTAYFYIHGLLGKYRHTAGFVPEAVEGITWSFSDYERDVEWRYVPEKREEAKLWGLLK